MDEIMISLIHPSRGRPEKSFKTINRWIDMAINKDGFEVVTSVDDSDPLIGLYNELFLVKGLSCFGNFLQLDNKNAISAINSAARIAQGDILMVASDDTECTEGWDTKLLHIVKGRTDWILKTQDGIQPWIITMPIMDRAYYNRFGYIYHPDYQHMFCDTELTCVADITGRKIKSDLLFKHNHYSVTKEKPDEISKRADATWDHGEKLFLERYKRNFDLPPGKPIEDNGMINWLKRKVR